MKKKLLSFFSLTAIAILAFAATQASRRADAQVLWQDATGVAVTWGSMVGAQEASVAADWKVGDILQITVKSFDTSIDEWPQVGFKSSVEGWPSICTFDSSVKNQTMPYVSKFYLTADMVEKLKANQFFISGTAATVTKLEYIKDESGTDYTNAIWIGESTFPAENWWTATAITIDKSSFANAKAGDKVEFRLSAKGSSLALQPFFGGWSGSKIGIGDNPERFTVDGNVVSIILTADEVTSLKSGGMILQAGDCTVRTIALTPMFAVNVDEGITNGTVAVDKATAAEGDEVTITATPADGYKLASLSVRGVTSDLVVTVTDNKFKMPADAVTVSAKFAQPEDITITPESGADIYTALKAATTDAGKVAKNITIVLAPNGAYTLSAPIEGGANIFIGSDANNPATIDASANAGAFIQMSSAPVVEKNTKEYYIVNVDIMNAKITGVKNSLFWDNKVKYCVENFNIENCVIDIPAEAAQNDAIISFQGGGAKTFRLTNSTISGAAKINYFLRYNGNNGRIDNMGYDKNTEKQTWIYENNTFYQVLKSNGQWGNGPAGQKYFVYSVKNNIWYNSSQDIARRLLDGQLGAESDVTFVKNTYFNGDADVSANQSSYDKSNTALTTNPTFKAAATGDFTIGASTAQAKFKTGDPRWLVDYVKPATSEVKPIVISPASGDITKAVVVEQYKIWNELNEVGDVTINLAANGAYTVSAPLEGNKNFTIAGPATLADGEKAPTIDASANTGAFVKMGTPVVTANSKNFYEVDNFAIKNVNVKNINSYVYDDNKNAYAFAEFAVENCVFEFTNSKSDIDAPFRFQGGGPVKFILKNNTMYQKGTKNYKYFVKIGSGNFPDKAFESFAGPYVWDIENNTFYQTIAHDADAKKAFINGGRVGNNFAKTSITILKNMFIDCAGSESFWKDLFGGKSSDSDRAQFVAINTDYNTYLTGGAVIDVSKYDKGENTLTSDPTFKDAANGDFTIGESTTQAKFKTGDPRWLVEYVAPLYVFGDITEGGWNSVTTKMTFNAETQAYEYDFVATKDVWFAFSDTEFAATEGNWDAVNAARYSLGDAEVTVGTAQDLVKGVDKSIKMPAGTWKASISVDLKTLTITGEAAPPPAEDTYVVAGEPASLFGTEWSGTAEANKMTKNAETGIYELKFTGVAFTAATTIEYKIVKNGSTWIPDGVGNNQTVSIPAAGTYDITFTFNPEGSVITGVATVSTGINGIYVDGVAGDIFSDGKPVYNLSGQRVFKGYKGVVIKNGRKVVVK